MSARTTFEDALWTWVQAATGLAAANVTWRDGKFNRPVGPYVELRLGPLAQVGQDWTETRDSDDPSPPSGEEIVTEARGMRTTELRLEAFQGKDGAATGDAAPDEVLARVMTKAALPSIRAALNAGGVGVTRFAPVQTIDGVLGNSGFEPRALLTVYLSLSAAETEFATYIGSVDIQQVDGEAVSVRDEFTVDEPT